MEFKTFFQTIKKYGEISGSPKQVVFELYKYAKIPTSEHSAESYYKGKRSSTVDRGKLCEPGFFQFFHERTGTTWHNVQKAFKNLHDSNNHTDPPVINFNTNDEHEFYESLLAQFYEIVRSGPISLLNILPTHSTFFGRETETMSIKNAILDQKAVTLTGIGGIGKSLLALECAHHFCRENSWLCQHVICEDDDTFRAAILKLQFDNPVQMSKLNKKNDSEQFSQRLLWLRNRNHPTLIILDNLNHALTPNDRADLSNLLDCGPHIHVLITNRNAKPSDGLRTIQIRPLDDRSLFELYAYHRFGGKSEGIHYIEENKETLLKLFSLFDRHTLMVILLAKLPNRTLMSDLEIYTRLAQGFQLPEEAVSLQKDSSVVECSAIHIIKQIFDISQFEETEKHTLRCMSMMPFGGIDIKTFETLTGCTRRTVLRLRDYNWIIVDNETLQIYLHPLICETILSRDELFPSEALSKKVLERTIRLLKNSSSEDSDKLKQIRASILSRISFRRIITYGPSEDPTLHLFDYVKDEYVSPLPDINALLIAVANKKKSSF